MDTVPGEPKRWPIAVVSDDDAVEEQAATQPPELADLTADTTDGFEIPTLGTLIDKRRVVVVAMQLSGFEERCRQLSQALSDLAYKRGAVVHERSERQVVALFGLEVAGEDDVANAMFFATDAAELVRGDRPVTGASDAVELRCAARAGVVAQRREGTYQLRGDAVREAVEMCRNAEPSRPLLSGGTGRIASAHFRFRELPPQKHRSRRLRVLQLLGPTDHEDRTRALRDRRGHFVGRSRELKRLHRIYETTLNNSRQDCVLITGSSGLGKSRLVSEFVSGIDGHDQPPMILAIASSEHASEAPFSTLIDYLHAALKLPPARGQSARSNVIQRVAAALQKADVPDEEARECCDALETAMEVSDGALGNATTEPPEALRTRTAGAVRILHAALAGGHPSVTILDNFYNADPVTVEVLQSIMLGDRCPTPNLVIITRLNDSDLSEQFAGATDIKLGDLAGDESEELIVDRLLGTDDVTPEMVRQLARRAGGNPLYIEELCRTVREVGWDSAPTTVRDSVVTRVDRLSNRSRAILQRAAVIGDSFRARILEELVGGTATRHLQELVDEGMLVRGDHAEYEAEGGDFTFRHGLIQEVVYASLAAGARRQTHAKLGRILSLRDEGGYNEPAVVTARHLELGGLEFEAVLYWIRAGRIALAASEIETARDYFGRALELIRSQPAGDPSSLRAQEIEARFGRAQAFRDLGEFDKQGLELDALGSLCADSTDDMARLMTEMAEGERRRCSYDKAIRLATDAVNRAQEAELPLLTGEALRIVAEAQLCLGKSDEARQSVDESLEIFEGQGAQTQGARTRLVLIRMLLDQGDDHAALPLFESVEEALAESHTPWLQRMATTARARLHVHLGEYERALEYATAANTLREADGDRALAAESALVAGTILAELGDFSGAQEQLNWSRARYEESQDCWATTTARIECAITACELGEFQRCFSLLGEARSVSRNLRSPQLRIRTALALALAHLRRGNEEDHSEARNASEEAIELARAYDMRKLLITALARHAEALRRQGGFLEEAARASGEAIELMDEGSHVQPNAEEVLYNHYQILREQADGECQHFLSRAFASYERKLEGISDLQRRQSLALVPTYQSILMTCEDTTHTA